MTKEESYAGERFSYELQALEHALLRLDRITARLRLMSSLAIGLTGLTVALAVVSGPAVRAAAYTLVVVWLPVVLSSALLAVTLLFQYDVLRRRGDVFFEEISDEVQWHITRSRESASPQISDSRPLLEARIVLRNFARTVDLPFVPGRYGALVYLAANVGALIIAALTVSPYLP